MAKRRKQQFSPEVTIVILAVFAALFLPKLLSRYLTTLTVIALITVAAVIVGIIVYVRMRDKTGRVVVWQNPNPALWVWIIGTVLGWLVHSKLHTIIGLIASLALTVWAVMEVGWGDSLFRRLLGGVVLLFMLVRLIKLL